MSNIRPDQDRDAVHVKIEARAYEIWVHEGCPEGHDLDHWLRAESEIASESAALEASDDVAAVARKKK